MAEDILLHFTNCWLTLAGRTLSDSQQCFQRIPVDTKFCNCYPIFQLYENYQCMQMVPVYKCILGPFACIDNCKLCPFAFIDKFRRKSSLSMHIYIYIYIYIDREREREREKSYFFWGGLSNHYPTINYLETFNCVGIFDHILCWIESNIFLGLRKNPVLIKEV